MVNRNKFEIVKFQNLIPNKHSANKQLVPSKNDSKLLKGRLIIAVVITSVQY